jgi:uncharacterized protein YdbL (DUF1318 family)
MVLLVASCVTVNVYFPAAAVQKAADEIVEDITKDTAAPPAPKPGPTGQLKGYFRYFSLGPKEAHAQQVDIKVSTPAIRAIRDTMRGVFHQLKPYYEKGAVGENNNGFVELRDAGSLNLQERGMVTNLVQQQNKQRTALYKEIAAANKMGPESVSQIQRIFANSWRDKSRAGWWVQDDKGAWVKK